jgi:hypothetical protein
VSSEEDFLARWSRRKRTVAQAEATEKAVKPSPPERSARPEAENVQPEEPVASPPSFALSPGEVRVDPPALPSLDSITAETDIRTFLAPGVPADLARAALRRAWAADPAIRDFIGLSENLTVTDWDLSASESMAGFGSLELTEDLRRAVAQLFTPTPGSGPQHVENKDVFAPAEDLPDAPSKQHIAFSQDENLSAQDESSARGESPQVSSVSDAVQQEPIEPTENHTTVRRGHGRALPK